MLCHPCRLSAKGELVPCPGLANAPILLRLGSCSPVLHSYLVVSSKGITSAQKDCPGCGPHFAGAYIGVAASVSAGTPDAPNMLQRESGWELVKPQGIKVNSSFVRSGSLCSLLTIPESGAFRHLVYFLWSRSCCKGLGAGMPCCRRVRAWLHVGSVAEPGDGNFLY